MNARDVCSQPVDHAVAPLGRCHLAADVPADLPVRFDQRNIDGLKCSLARGIDKPDDRLETPSSTVAANAAASLLDLRFIPEAPIGTCEPAAQSEKSVLRNSANGTTDLPWTKATSSFIQYRASYQSGAIATHSPALCVAPPSVFLPPSIGGGVLAVAPPPGLHTAI